MAVTLHNRMNADTLMIPGVFVDEYLPGAKGDYVKVYLYLLRRMTSERGDCSLAAMAELFETTEKEILRALNYWEKAGVVRLSFNSDHVLSEVTFVDVLPMRAAAQKTSYPETASPDLTREEAGRLLADTEAAASSTLSLEPSAAAGEGSAGSRLEAQPPVHRSAGAAAVEKLKTASGQTTQRQAEHERLEEREMLLLEEDSLFQQLLFVVEAYLGVMIKPVDKEILAYWYVQFGQSEEVIEYLAEYCAEQLKKKGSTGSGGGPIRYMENVAREWHKQGLRTVEEIREYSGSRNKTVYAVMKAFGLRGRDPGKEELDYIRKWSRDYGFAEELILMACDRTISRIHDPSFQYTDGILQSWRLAGVKTAADVAAQDEEYQKKSGAGRKSSGKKRDSFHNFDERETDYDQLVDQFGF